MAAVTNYDHLLKVVIIGDSGVGKTCLMTRFCDGTFSDAFISTIGVDFKVNTIELDRKVIKLQIWDTAGQERFRTLTASYYRGSHGVFVVYDVTNAPSFANVKKWLEEIQNNCDNEIARESLVLVGNKSDQEDRRVVLKEDAEEIAKQFNMTYFEASAKSGLNVQESFATLAQKMLDAKLRHPTNAAKPATIDVRSSGGGDGGGPAKPKCCK